jgi:hypothetical protein
MLNRWLTVSTSDKKLNHSTPLIDTGNASGTQAVQQSGFQYTLSLRDVNLHSRRAAGTHRCPG